MNAPFDKVKIPETAEYRRLAKRFIRETVLRFGVLIVPISVLLLLSVRSVFHLAGAPFLDLRNVGLFFGVLIYTVLTIGVGGYLHARRQLEFFIENGRVLSEELFSPYVKRKIESPLDPISTFDQCANVVSSIKLAEELGYSKTLRFSYDPFKGSIFLSRSRIAFLDLAIHIQVETVQGQITKISVESKPGGTRFYMQNGDALRWVEIVTKSLSDALHERRYALDSHKREQLLERAVLEAKLATLQAQVEPHFLFNTLANLKYLIRTDTALAQDLLSYLVGYLHTALPDMRSISSNVAREFELAEHYLHIMQIRMGERLQFQLSIDAGLEMVSMPPAMLISLVENAIKHGLEKATKPGTIYISAQTDQQHIRISVADDGVGLTTLAGQGVGLVNIHQRLALLYGDTASLRVEPNAKQGVVASILLPLASPIK